MAAAELLRAYLDWQAEIGTEEVILSAPLAQPARQAAPAAQASGRAPVSPASPAGARYEESATDTTPPAGLFESLSKALQSGSGGLSQAASPAPAATRAPDLSALPAFPDLAALWTHLEANPSLAAGDPTATVTRVIRGVGASGAGLALVGLEPGEADSQEGLALQGAPGELLVKMIKAIKMDPAGCYLTNLHKAARPAKAGRRDIVRLLPWLHLELGLVRAPFVLLLGEACAQAVLKVGKSLDELRQEPHRMEGREFIVTYHPRELLEREELKRKAWEDLQWLQKRMAGSKAEA